MSNSVFVLSYVNANEFFSRTSSTKPSFNTYFIDNGNQIYTPSFSCKTYTTSRNIGCAGGWNLICDIAFDTLDLNKIVITQDDAEVGEPLLHQALEETHGSMITGIFPPFFEFSTFVITKEVWRTVGRFDENFIYVYSEDADYKQRCMLSGVTINSLYAQNVSNTSASRKAVNKIQANRQYLTSKWGSSIHPSGVARADFQPPFEYRQPFGTAIAPLDYAPISSELKQLYTLSNEFPSELEYERFKQNGFYERI